MGMVEKNRGQIHKYKAYAKAVRALKAHPSKITSGKEAEALDGIGKKIAAKIDEILESGHLKKLETELEDERTKAINEVAQVSGIGPAAAKKLVDEDGIKSLEDLKNNIEKLNNHQQIGLKYFDDFNQRIPRAEVKKIEVRTVK
jgi:DNA polymerase beta